MNYTQGPVRVKLVHLTEPPKIYETVVFPIESLDRLNPVVDRVAANRSPLLHHGHWADTRQNVLMRSTVKLSEGDPLEFRRR